MADVARAAIFLRQTLGATSVVNQKGHMPALRLPIRFDN